MLIVTPATDEFIHRCEHLADSGDIVDADGGGKQAIEPDPLGALWQDLHQESDSCQSKLARPASGGASDEQLAVKGTTGLRMVFPLAAEGHTGSARLPFVFSVAHRGTSWPKCLTR
jgi:hypothetical protein